MNTISKDFSGWFSPEFTEYASKEELNQTQNNQKRKSNKKFYKSLTREAFKIIAHVCLNPIANAFSSYIPTDMSYATTGAAVAFSASHASGSAISSNRNALLFAVTGLFSTATASHNPTFRHLLANNPPVVNRPIENQAVFAGNLFALTIDLQHVFNYTYDNQINFQFSQADGSPLPNWLNVAPLNPTLVGSLDTDGYSYGVTVVSNTAYVADNFAGLKIIDVSNPSSPSLVSGLDTSGKALDITVTDNTAYIADYSSGLKIINITKPVTPTLIGNLDTDGEAWGITVVNNTAYVADATAGLKIIDLINPEFPTLLGSFDTDGQAKCVAVMSDTAYVADYSDGLKIINVSNPCAPILVGSFETGGHAMGIVVVGNTAYIADGPGGLKIIDVSDPTTPTLIGSLGSYFTYNVYVVDNYAYVTDYTSGITIIDISNPANPAFISKLNTNGLAYDIAVINNYAYVTDYYAGLKIISHTKRKLSGLPKAENRGVLPIKLTANNALGQTTSTVFSITILNNSPTTPVIPPKDVHNAFSFTITPFNDVDDDKLTYSATLPDGSLIPSWIIFNPTTLQCSGTTPQAIGQTNLMIKAKDSFGGTTIGTQIINIVNSPPIANTTLIPTKMVFSKFSFNITFENTFFKDPEGDPITYSATLLHGKPLPTWLSFNPNTKTFSGIAPTSKLGITQVTLTATDSYKTKTSRSFDINVLAPANKLPQKTGIPKDHSVGIEETISFQFSNTTFSDPDLDTLKLSASLEEGIPLPTWLIFNPTNQNFNGIAPSKPQILTIIVKAEDWQQIPVQASFQLAIYDTANYPPKITTPLSNLVANVGQEFKFVVPKTTFQDVNVQDKLIFSATLVSGEPLPEWLNFDQNTRTFSGLPGREDTNPFGDKPLPIRLTASDETEKTATEFTITVQGESNAELGVKLGTIFGSFASIASATYAYRGFIWKKTMKHMYKLPTEYVQLGRESDYFHTITHLRPEEVSLVKVLRNGQSLPGGALQTDWFKYNVSRAKITLNPSSLDSPDDLTNNRWTVRIKNRDGWINGLVWEEFDIEFVDRLPENGNEEFSDAPMETVETIVELGNINV